MRKQLIDWYFETNGISANILSEEYRMPAPTIIALKEVSRQLVIESLKKHFAINTAAELRKAIGNLTNKELKQLIY